MEHQEIHFVPDESPNLHQHLSAVTANSSSCFEPDPVILADDTQGFESIDLTWGCLDDHPHFPSQDASYPSKRTSEDSYDGYSISTHASTSPSGQRTETQQSTDLDCRSCGAPFSSVEDLLYASL